MKTSVEVRCCCDAGKLLGWLEVDLDRYKGQKYINFPMILIPNEVAGTIEASYKISDKVFKDVTLELAKFQKGDPDGGQTSIALKDLNHPIETLRMIPGFKEKI